MFKRDPWGLKTITPTRERVTQILHVSPVYLQQPGTPESPSTQWNVVVVTEVHLVSKPDEVRQRQRTVRVRGRNELEVYAKLIGKGLEA